MKTLLSATLAASILIGGAAAHAQSGAGHDHGPRGGKMMEMLDGNKDGTITRAEATTALTQHFATMDTDKNGTITQAEREATRSRMMQERFAKMDTDKNGQLSQQELMSAREAKREGMGGKMRGKMGRMMKGDMTRDQFLARPMAMFDRVDTNKDGQITAAEREAAKDAMHRRWEARKDKRDAG
jgi:Ca2+-binding EF-hand superfamily protein